mmetsp:Transcript_12029/g.30464  ORF Transcript_12029/g.30464 Transcript_12029/m.30464 type:complete len:225 (-) Transcript_12029:277-951(-)
MTLGFLFVWSSALRGLLHDVGLLPTAAAAQAHLQFTTESQSISQRKTTQCNAFVGAQLGVESVDRFGVFVKVLLFTGWSAVPESVVDRDNATDAQQLQTLLVVDIVVVLVGINEHQIVGTSFAVLQHLIHAVRGGSNAHVDAILYTGLLPEGTRHTHVLIRYIQSDHFTISRKSCSHCECRVTFEDTDFDHLLRVHQREKKRQELGLVGRCRHLRVGLSGQSLT